MIRTVNPAALTIVAVFAVAATTGAATQLIENTENQLNAESATLEGHVTVERNGETVAEVSNVMLDGERIITSQVTGDNEDGAEDLTYNTIALGDSDDTEFDSADSDLTAEGQRYCYAEGCPEDADAVENDDNLEHVEGFEPGDATVDYDNNGQEWEATYEFELTDSSYEEDDLEVSSTALEVDVSDAESPDEFNENSDENTFAATNLDREIPMRMDDQITITWEVTPQNE